MKMNLQTAKNRAVAMNKVHALKNALYAPLLALFPLNDVSMYNTGFIINKATRAKMKAIIDSLNVDGLRVVTNDDYNSIHLKIDTTYNVDGQCGCKYYHQTLYLVSIKQDEKNNVPVPHMPEEYATNFTGAKLMTMQRKVKKLEEKITDLKREKSALNYWLEG